MESPIGKIIGGCRIEDLIGRGGMGAVYKAHHTALDIPVAVKLLQPVSPMANEEERFLREARTAARLRHPNIVGVLNVGSEDGFHYIVMEYVNGKNLLNIIQEKGKLSIEETLNISIQVLKALECAYQNKIVHRDVKPENILIEPSLNVKLTDLGLAKRDTDISITGDCTALGSPCYIAPEQAENARGADHRSDIYSLGCTMYHMLTGVPPFGGNSPVEIILEHIRKPVPVLIDMNKKIPAEISEIVRKMMDKDPLLRFQTPDQAIQLLQNYLQNSNRRSGKDVARAAVPVSGNRTALYLNIVASVVLLLSLILLGVIGFKKIAPQSTTVKANVDRAREPVNKKDSLVKPPKSTSGKKHSSQIAKQESANTDAEKIINIIREGNNQLLKRVLDKGKAPNPSAGLPGATPLHEAVRFGSEQNVRTLLQKGANPNLRDYSGDCPLHLAIQSRNLGITRALLDFGANPNVPNHSGLKPLKMTSDVSFQRLLRERGAN